jgi:glycosyltransferase involved in cell wall biosynthesis
MYVGAVGRDYEVGAMLEAFKECPNATLALCTRQDEWTAWLAANRQTTVPANVVVYHVGGDALESVYAGCNAASLFLPPSEYRSFAAPFKLFEYVGHGLPVIASEGTMAGQVVKDNDIGWCLPHSVPALRDLLGHLTVQEILEARQRVERFQEANLWTERARQVAKVLTRREKTT